MRLVRQVHSPERAEMQARELRDLRRIDAVIFGASAVIVAAIIGGYVGMIAAVIP